jgi:hypothetical protein
MAKQCEQPITTAPQISPNRVVSSPSPTRARHQEANPGVCIDSEPDKTTSRVVIRDKPLHGCKGSTIKATSAKHLQPGISSGVRNTTLSPREARSFSSKRKSTVDHSRLLGKRRIVGSQWSVSQELQEVIIEMEKMEKTSRTPPSLHSQLGAEPRVLKLVMAISSRAAFIQFHGLVSGARDGNDSVMRLMGYGDLCTRAWYNASKA